MANDFIRRENAKALFCKCCEETSKVKCWLCKRKHPMDEIPAADVRKVVRGRWLGGETSADADGFPVYDTLLCSVCGMEWDAQEADCVFNFCPNCGADMRPSEEPENLIYIPPEERSGVDDD